MLVDQRISRRHAMIQRQGEQEYWLVDFGSRNGTYMNGRRIAQPTRLQDGCKISLGGIELVFHQADDQAPMQEEKVIQGDMTLYDVRPSHTWLLVADVIGSTQMVANLPPDALPVMMGQWLMACREIIEGTGGRINQFMGDGFFAYWPDRPGIDPDILRAIESLHQMQAKAQPNFRVVLHLGPVILGGIAIGEEERISGGEVHYAFRMEKLAGKLGHATLFSEPVYERLHEHLHLQLQGRHPLQGFDGDFAFYSL